jgi:hypothetical protein
MTMGVYSASGANGKDKKKATLERIHREAIELGHLSPISGLGMFKNHLLAGQRLATLCSKGEHLVMPS